MATGTGTPVTPTPGTGTFSLAKFRAWMRDVSGSTFSDSVIHESIAAAHRMLWPRFFTVKRVDLGVLQPGVSSVVLPTVAWSSDQRRFYCFEFRTGKGEWLARPGSYEEGGSIYFPPLTRSRACRAVYLCGAADYVSVPPTLSVGDGWDDAVQYLAAAHLLDGYLHGRVPYDKYTTVTSDDAVSPYEVRDAAQAFHEWAEKRVRELERALPAVRVR